MRAGHAGGSLQKQLQSAEARAEAADKSAASLQQHVLTWQSRLKRRDAEMTGLTAKVPTSPACPHASQIQHPHEEMINHCGGTVQTVLRI